MEPIIAFTSIALLIVGLVGQGFEMRKIKQSILKENDNVSENIFLDRRNIKWYVIIGAGIALWYVSS